MRQMDSTLPRRFTPTTSLYPHTTVGNIKIPLNAISLYDSKRKLTDASLYDTPGIEGENSFLFQYLWAAYHKATGLKKLGGFQREPVKMTAGITLRPHSMLIYRTNNAAWRSGAVRRLGMYGSPIDAGFATYPPDIIQ